jgi:hypothetical protein
MLAVWLFRQTTGPVSEAPDWNDRSVSSLIIRGSSGGHGLQRRLSTRGTDLPSFESLFPGGKTRPALVEPPSSLYVHPGALVQTN